MAFPQMTDWHLYIIDKDGRYYVGIATDLPNRLRQHGHPTLLYASSAMTCNEAVTIARTVKGWSEPKIVAWFGSPVAFGHPEFHLSKFSEGWQLWGRPQGHGPGSEDGSAAESRNHWIGKGGGWKSSEPDP